MRPQPIIFSFLCNYPNLRIDLSTFTKEADSGSALDMYPRHPQNVHPKKFGELAIQFFFFGRPPQKMRRISVAHTILVDEYDFYN